MPDYSIVIILALAVIVFLFFSLARDKSARHRFIGEKRNSQTSYSFVDGVVFLAIFVGIYALFQLIRWIWIHSALQG